MSDEFEASLHSSRAAKRRNTKAPKSSRKVPVEKDRVQFHLPVELIRRLGVHATLVNLSHSDVVAKILGDYLIRHGRGKEIFGGSDASTGANSPEIPAA
jgi:hypothetical protein